MSLEDEIRTTLNRHSAENASDTPDFVLAGFLTGCLNAFNVAVVERERFYSREVGGGKAIGVAIRAMGDDETETPTETIPGETFATQETEHHGS